MKSIVEMISYFAQEKPQKVAVIADGESLTYAELWTLVKGFANYLKSEGIKKGDRVIVKSRHSLWFVISCFGIHLSGAVHVPLEKSIGDDGLREVAEEYAASMIISDKKLEGVDCIQVDFPDVMRLAKAHVSDNDQFVFPEGDDICDIMFTTGTTGKSKGVIKSHYAVSSVADNTACSENIPEDNVYLLAVPVNHISGIRKLYCTMFTGTTVVLLDGFSNMKKFYQYLTDYKINSLYLTPSAIRIILLLSAKKLAGFQDQITFVSIGAEAFPEADKERLCEILPKTKLFFVYGSSEAGRITQLEYSKYHGLANCIGVPSKGVEVFIVDENRNIIKSSKDNTGCIAIKSPAVMKGYYNAPELTAEVLSDGIIYTNDIGYIDENGFIFMLGRKGDIINVGGLKVAPTEVESVALRYPGIAECACFGVTERTGAVVPKLNIVQADGADVDIIQLREFMQKYLENYKIPKTIDVVESIPKTSNGKINRKLLK